MAKTKKQPQLSPKKYIQTKARSLPIHECWINSSWQRCGLAQILVSRKHKSGNNTLGFFLVDLKCVGLKEAFYKFNIPDDEYDDTKDIFCANGAEQIPYELVHNIVYGGIEYAEELGISPCPDFAVTQYILEEDTDDIPVIDLDFGLNGEPVFFALSKQELNKYLPALQRTVPDIEFHLDEDPFFEDESELNENKLFDQIENVGQNLFNVLNLYEALDEHREKSLKMKRSVYQYQNPEYPDTLNLENPLFKDLFKKENNDALSPAFIMKLMIFERESLFRDLEHIILYETGCTYPLIDKRDWPEEYIGTLMHAVILLAELEATSSLPVILQLLRQSPTFIQYHYGDVYLKIFPPAIFKLAVGQLPLLFDFMKEPGLDARNKIAVSKAVSAIGVKYPERRKEVIEWYRGLMNFYIDNLDNHLIYDAELSGSLICGLKDLKAKELLPEIERMYATQQVDSFLALNYQIVSNEILSPGEPSTELQVLSIFDWYKSIE